MIVAAPPVAPIVAANAIKIFRVAPLPTYTLTSEAVAALAAPAAAVTAETGALALLWPLAAVGAAGAAAWLVWNWATAVKSQRPLPTIPRSWFVDLTYEDCIDEQFIGIGTVCLAWGGVTYVEHGQFQDYPMGAIFYWKEQTSTRTFKTGRRVYKDDALEYGDEVVQEWGHEAGLDYARKRIVGHRIFYRDYYPGHPHYGPEVDLPEFNDPSVSNPFWQGGELLGKPYQFPDPAPADPLPLPGDPIPATPYRPWPFPEPSPEPAPKPRPRPDPGPGPAPAPAPEFVPTPAPAPPPAPPRPPLPKAPPDTGKKKPRIEPEPPKRAPIPWPPFGDPLIDTDGDPQDPEPDPPREKPPYETDIGEEKVGRPGQAPRPTLDGIAFELGNLEAKLEILMLRRPQGGDLADLLGQVLDLLGQLAEGGGGGNGGGGDCKVPDMGPVEIVSVPPYAGDQAQYQGGAYRVKIDKAPADVFMADAIVKLADLMSVQKSWRNYMAPKVKSGRPFTITWEETD